MSLSTDDQRIIREIEAHIASRGGTYPEWYVGIATDPEQRVFGDHNVDRQNGYWIYRQAGSSDHARTIEDHFHNVRHAKGDSGGGNDDTTIHVYAYRITASTREE